MIGVLKNFILFVVIAVVVNSQDNDQSCLTTVRMKGIKQLRTTVDKIPENLKKEIRNETAVVFLGLLKSGRSTLVNYLIGNKLIAHKLNRYSGIKIALDKTLNSSGPEIGDGPTALTKIPTRWESGKLPGFGIWDTPGFDDNRGSEQDIENSFYNYELIKNAECIKFVLVIDFYIVVNSNVRLFLTVFDRFESFFEDSVKDSLSNISVIFTKIPEKSEEGVAVDKQYIASVLEDKFLSSSDLMISEFAKKCIKFLVDNKQSFGFFKNPSVDGNLIDASYDEGIIQAINNAVSLPTKSLGKLSPPVSSQSQIFLRESHEELVSDAKFDNIKKIMIDVISEKFPDAKNHDKEYLEKIRDDLVTIDKDIDLFRNRSSDFSGLIKFIEKFYPQIKEEVRYDCLIEKVNLLSFVERILKSEEKKQFKIGLESVIATIDGEVLKGIESVEGLLRKVENSEIANQISKFEETNRKLEDSKRQLEKREKSAADLSSKVNSFLILGALIQWLRGL